MHLLGVEVLLEHFELAAHPRVADRAIERGQRVEHEALQSLLHQQIRKRLLQRDRIVGLQHRDDAATERRCEIGAARGGWYAFQSRLSKTIGAIVESRCQSVPSPRHNARTRLPDTGLRKRNGYSTRSRAACSVAGHGATLLPRMARPAFARASNFLT